MFWRRRPEAPKRVTLLDHFGAGNLGNECTLQAAIQQTLIHLPEAVLQCARVRRGSANQPARNFPHRHCVKINRAPSQAGMTYSSGGGRFFMAWESVMLRG